MLINRLQQKARDNRAALRINKVQMSNETIKRQQQSQTSQPLEVFDPAIPPLDPELLFKDPLKHKESEQEQEWKLRQVTPCRSNVQEHTLKIAHITQLVTVLHITNVPYSHCCSSKKIRSDAQIPIKTLIHSRLATTSLKCSF